jgi:hypothetical protein
MEKLFAEPSAVALFLIFFVPGFVMIKVYDALVPGERRDFSKTIFDAVAYGALNLAAFSPFISYMRYGGPDPVVFWGGAIVILLVGPALWAWALFKFLSAKQLRGQAAHPIQRAWDYVFSRGHSYWVIIHLENRKIGGLFGSNSFASSDPADPQIYIEEVWELDANEIFVRRIDRSNGMILFAKDIVAVEFFSYSEAGGSSSSCPTTNSAVA